MNNFRIVSRKEIDTERWDQLVESRSNYELFSSAMYLDQLSENWSAVVNDDYTSGMPIPFSIRLGVKKWYTPNFMRYTEWLGKTPQDIEAILEKIRNEFPLADINMKENYFLANLQKSEIRIEKKVYQILESKGEIKYNQRTKRTLKKFSDSGALVRKGELSEVLDLINKELVSKVISLRKVDLSRFESLLQQLDKHGKLTLLVLEFENEICGGMIFTEFKQRHYYLKGGANSKGKEIGGMYAMMGYYMDKMLPENAILDFVGSNVDGVREFNKGFGANDVSYFNVRWDKSPFWFRNLKSVLKR